MNVCGPCIITSGSAIGVRNRKASPQVKWTLAILVILVIWSLVNLVCAVCQHLRYATHGGELNLSHPITGTLQWWGRGYSGLRSGLVLSMDAVVATLSCGLGLFSKWMRVDPCCIPSATCQQHLLEGLTYLKNCSSGANSAKPAQTNSSQTAYIPINGHRWSMRGYSW
jgi:hypothetical protein